MPKICPKCSGTANNGSFLTDQTGSRRYWIVPVNGKIDISRLEKEIDGIWAAAVQAFNNGEHPRTRERLMALSEISEGKSAIVVGKQTKRNPQTVISWVHRYIREGIARLKYNEQEEETLFF